MLMKDRCCSTSSSVNTTCSFQLSSIGLELTFVLDTLILPDLEKILKDAAELQVEAIRHRASVCIVHKLFLLQHLVVITVIKFLRKAGIHKDSKL